MLCFIFSILSDFVFVFEVSWSIGNLFSGFAKHIPFSVNFGSPQ